MLSTSEQGVVNTEFRGNHHTGCLCLEVGGNMYQEGIDQDTTACFRLRRDEQFAYKETGITPQATHT